MNTLNNARKVANRRGATLVFVAITLTTMLAAMALAIDLGMLLTARSEAQRAADAAALAGAQEFMKRRPREAVPFARHFAYDFAQLNSIRKVRIDSSEVQVEIFPDRRVVQVTVTRQGLPTWFARIFGVDEVPVAALAAAEAAEASSVKCLKPFAIPDLWKDNTGEDVNGNGQPDPGENWTYNPGQDFYKPYIGTEGDGATGYGSELRDNGLLQGDRGRRMKLKVTNPNDPDQWVSSFFNPIRLSGERTNMENCSKQGGNDHSGASNYRNNICACNTASYAIGDSMHVEPGNMVGPTEDGITDLYNTDPSAQWYEDADGGHVVNSQYGDDWMNSPRVVKIAIFSPDQITHPSDKFFVVTNFALVFVEGQECAEEKKARKCAVMARFVGYAQGDGERESEVTGSLVKVLRLIR
jgi:hypothetical protein